MTAAIIQSVAMTLVGIGLIFCAGYWWAEGRRWTSAGCLFGGAFTLVGQFTAFLAFLAPMIK